MSKFDKSIDSNELQLENIYCKFNIDDILFENIIDFKELHP